MKNIDIKFLLLGIILFLPQAILSSFSTGLIFTQRFENIKEVETTILSEKKIITLKVSTAVNFVLVLLTSFLTLLKVYKNY